jgi:hypothetical protein
LHHTAQSAIPTKNRKLEYECHNFAESHFQQLDCICILFITRQAEKFLTAIVKLHTSRKKFFTAFFKLSTSKKKSSQLSSSYIQAEIILHSFLQATYKQKKIFTAFFKLCTSRRFLSSFLQATYKLITTSHSLSMYTPQLSIERQERLFPAGNGIRTIGAQYTENE